MIEPLNSNEITDTQLIVNDILDKNKKSIKNTKLFQAALIGMLGIGLVLVIGSQLLMYGFQGMITDHWNGVGGLTLIAFIFSFFMIGVIGKELKNLESIDYSISTIDLLRNTLMKYDYSLSTNFKRYGWKMNLLLLFLMGFLGLYLYSILSMFWSINPIVYFFAYLIIFGIIVILFIQIILYNSRDLRNRINRLIRESESI